MVAERGYAQVTGMEPADEKSSAIDLQPGAPPLAWRRRRRLRRTSKRFAYARGVCRERSGTPEDLWQHPRGEGESGRRISSGARQWRTGSGVAVPTPRASQCGCKTTKRKAKDPQSQSVVEGNNTLVAAPRKYDRFQAAEAHLPDGVVKEEFREFHAATLAECSGRLAPGWRQQRTGVANKTELLEAKRKMLAELEVATLVAAHALMKGKAAAAVSAAVAEECRAAEAEVLAARASTSASLAAAVPEVPVTSCRGKNFGELLDGPGWRVASAPRGAETSDAM